MALADVVQRLVTAAARLEPTLNRRVCLIGGLARDVWAEERTTRDVDVIIDAPNAEVALQAAPALGLVFVDAEVASLRPALMTRLRLPDELTGKSRIDVIANSFDYYGRVLDRAVVVDAFGSRLRVASAEDIIVLKTLAARPQDLADIAAIIAAQGDRLDRALIRAECTALEIDPPAGL